MLWLCARVIRFESGLNKDSKILLKSILQLHLLKIYDVRLSFKFIPPI